ncbi:MAG: LLM class flavin-dependent oxidoreductase [Gammaproteobacteria bacterium]|nr:LLM class flavin-dependent oxidoreductase [Gammaproteobacteria bacterium]
MAGRPWLRLCLDRRHHSAGVEIIASPEVFIAAAAERTRHIKLGTGVSSLPYHHPLILADRIMQLDHMTRGRVAFGVTRLPRALPSDAWMMGIDPGNQRDMMLEAIEVLVPLLKGERVTRKTSWFELGAEQGSNSPLTQSRWSKWPSHLRSHPPALVPRAPSGSACSRSGPLRLAASMRSRPTGRLYERKARENEQPTDRSRWSLVGPMHIAESREQAMANIRHGLDDWVRYFQRSGSDSPGSIGWFGSCRGVGGKRHGRHRHA